MRSARTVRAATNQIARRAGGAVSAESALSLRLRKPDAMQAVGGQQAMNISDFRHPISSHKSHVDAQAATATCLTNRTRPTSHGVSKISLAAAPPGACRGRTDRVSARLTDHSNPAGLIPKTVAHGSLLRARPFPNSALLNRLTNLTAPLSPAAAGPCVAQSVTIPRSAARFSTFSFPPHPALPPAAPSLPFQPPSGRWERSPLVPTDSCGLVPVSSPTGAS